MGVLDAIFSALGFGKKDENKFVSPIPLTTPTPTPTPNIDKIQEEAIKKGFENIRPNLPVATLSADFVREAKKNKLNPYLLPAVSINETTGGLNQTFENNPFNWGIYAGYKAKSPVEAIQKAASGIGTGRAFPYYEEYRKTGNLWDFVKHYAPPNENDSKKYLRDLEELIKMFKSFEKK